MMATTTRTKRPTKTAAAGKPPVKRKGPTTYQRNLRSRRNYQREREAARLQYVQESRALEVQSHGQRLRQTSHEQYRRQAVGAATSTLTTTPKMPQPKSNAGNLVMLYFVGGLVLVLVYVAFRNGPGTVNVLNTITGFLTHFASEQPLFQAQGGTPLAGTAPAQAVGPFGQTGPPGIAPILGGHS